MTTITGFTSARSQAIEDAIITGARITAGNLILTRKNGTEFNAGDVYGSQHVNHNRTSAMTVSGTDTNATSNYVLFTPSVTVSFTKHRSDTKLNLNYYGSVSQMLSEKTFTVAVTYGSTTQVLCHGVYNFGPHNGMHQISNLASGPYTFYLKYKSESGGVAISGITGQRNVLSVTETF